MFFDNIVSSIAEMLKKKTTEEIDISKGMISEVTYVEEKIDVPERTEFFEEKESIEETIVPIKSNISEEMIVSENLKEEKELSTEDGVFINKFVKVCNKDKIYSSGNYKVGEQLDAGELYFWGENIWYTKKGRKERNYHEYTNDTYDSVKKGDSLLVEEGYFTYIENVEFLWNKEKMLVPGHIYRLGVEVPRGSYLIKYDSAYVSRDGHFSEEEKEKSSVDVYEDYTSGRCYRTYGHCDVVHITNENGYVEIKNGYAVFITEEKFDEFNVVKNWLIEENRFFYKGIPVFKNKFFDVRLYKKYFNGGRFIGEYPMDVREYYIYSIDNVLKWRADIYPLTLQRPQTMTLLFVGGKQRIEIEITDFRYRYEREINEKMYTVSTILPEFLLGCVLEIYLVEYNGNRVMEPLKDCVNPYRIGAFNLSEYADEFNKLKELLSFYEELDVEEELCYFEKYPQYLKVVIQCLEEVVAAKPSFDRKKGIDDKLFSFNVKIDYSKYYYCASKLADHAISICKNDEFYTVCFKGSQLQELEVMSYLFYDILNEEDKLVRAYLNEYSYLYYSWNTIQLAINEFNENNGYSTVMTNSVLTNIIKVLRKRLQNRADLVYSEIAKEGRIQSRWGNEYLLFMTVSKFVEKVQYQYHCNWLGQQSFDIYLEDYKCAIEYQGQQHYDAVSIFGGEEGLKRTKERDARKRELATRNKVRVLDWMYTESITDESVKQFLLAGGIHINDKISQVSIEPVREMAPVIKKERPKKVSPPKEKTIKNFYVQYSLEGNMIKKYTTMAEASEETGIAGTSIARVIRGERNSVGGYVWKKYGVDEDVPQVIEIDFDVELINSGMPKRVARINDEGEIIKEYASITQAAKECKIQQRTIRAKIRKNIEWKYIE